MGAKGAKSSGLRRVLDLIAWGAAAVIVGGLIANASPGPHARPSPEPTPSVAPSPSPTPSPSPSPEETSSSGAPESVASLSACEGLRALANAFCRVGANDEAHPNKGTQSAGEHLAQNQDRQDARDEGNGGHGGSGGNGGADGSAAGSEEPSTESQDPPSDAPGRSGDEHGQGKGPSR